MNTTTFSASAALLLAIGALAGCGDKNSTQPEGTQQAGTAGQLTDEQVQNLVRRSYQYVAMYNVNNKFAVSQGG